MTDHNEAMRLADSIHEMNNAAYMTAIANLTAERDTLRTDLHIARDDAAQMLASTQALRAEVERLRGDAERWREISAMTENAERSLLKLADENERLEERLRTASAAFQREQDRADAAEIRAETAHAAGRDQGLREAKEVCEAHKADYEFSQYRGSAAMSAGDCATAIEQLRGK